MLMIALSALSGWAALLWLWPAATVATPARSGVEAFSGTAVGLVAIVVLAVMLRSVTVAVEGPLLVFTWRRLRARSGQRRRSAEALTATVACVDQVALQLRAGRSLSSAFGDGVRGSTLPNDHPLVAAVEESEAGTPLREALARHADEPVDQSGRLLVTTIEVLAASGGPASHALERAADTLRERSAAAGDARTQAQQAVTSASMLSLLPALFAGLSAAVEPDLASFYLQHWMGCACVVSATMLMLGGWLWIDRLVWEAP